VAESKLTPFCMEGVSLLENVAKALKWHISLVWVITVSITTTLMQKGITIIIKNNVDLDPRHLVLEFLISVSGVAFIWKNMVLEPQDLL